MLKRYFCSRVPLFTPVTLNYVASHGEDEVSLLSQMETEGFRIGVDYSPRDFNQMAKADTNHAIYWPQKYVHAVTLTEDRFLNCDQNPEAAIQTIQMAAKGD